MSKFCSNCNKDFADEAMFCPDCGSKLDNKEKGFIEIEDNTETIDDGRQVHTPALPKELPNVNELQNVVNDADNKAYRPTMGKFSFISMILLSLITLGIYWFYWINKFQKSVNSFVGRDVAATGWKLVLYIIITLGIYSIYLFYEDIFALNEAKNQRSMPGGRRSVAVCIILMMFGLSIIPWYWMISDANDIIDYENWKNGH